MATTRTSATSAASPTCRATRSRASATRAPRTARSCTLNDTHIFGANARQRGPPRLQPHQHHVRAQRAAEPGGLRHQQRDRRGAGAAADHRAGRRPQLRRPGRLPPGPHRHDLRALRHAQLPARPPLVQVRRRVPPLPQRQLRQTNGGTFTYPSLADFQAGRGSAFTVTLGDIDSDITQQALGLFVQDNFRLRANLTLELGLRYDRNIAPTEARRPLRLLRPRDRLAAAGGPGRPRQDLRRQGQLPAAHRRRLGPLRRREDARCAPPTRS